MATQRAAWFGEEVTGLQVELVWEDGVSKIGRFNSSPLNDVNGNICGAIRTMEDITDIVHMTRELDRQKTHHEQIVEDLQESKELFHTTIENMMDYVSICTAVRSKNGQIVDFVVDYVNQVVCDNSQKAKGKLTGHSSLAFYPKVIESSFLKIL